MLISISGRPPRWPLQPWACSILDRFRELGTTPADGEAVTAELAGCYNQGALIELHLGRVDNARALCHAHLHWHDTFWQEDHAEYRLKLAVQPWVNLLRLDAQSGAGAGARAGFRALRTATVHDVVRLGDLQVSGTRWHAMLDDSGFDQFVSHVYVRDTARSLVKDRVWAEARRFADETHRPDAAADDPPVLVELAVLADIMEGRCDQALQTATSSCAEVASYASLFTYYKARTLAQGGSQDRAIRFLEEAVQLIVDRVVSDARRPSDAMLMYEIAALSEVLGDRQLAFEIAQLAHTAACASADEVLAVRCCAMLARNGQRETAEYWRHEHERGLADTVYACLGAHPSADLVGQGSAAHQGALFAALTEGAR